MKELMNPETGLTKERGEKDFETEAEKIINEATALLIDKARASYGNANPDLLKIEEIIKSRCGSLATEIVTDIEKIKKTQKSTIGKEFPGTGKAALPEKVKIEAKPENFEAEAKEIMRNTIKLVMENIRVCYGDNDPDVEHLEKRIKQSGNRLIEVHLTGKSNWDQTKDFINLCHMLSPREEVLDSIIKKSGFLDYFNIKLIKPIEYGNQNIGGYPEYKHKYGEEDMEQLLLKSIDYNIRNHAGVLGPDNIIKTIWPQIIHRAGELRQRDPIILTYEGYQALQKKIEPMMR